MTLTHPLVDVAELNGEPWEVITAYRDFWERFPTVTDAAQAVLDGRPAVMRSEFPVEVERRLVKRFRGVVYVRTRVYLPPSADDTVMCSYLNEPDRDSAEVALRECLPLLLPESVRDRMIVVSHVSDTVMRRFAFEHLVPATMESWAEYHE
ncbi:hypothetical protein AB0O47_40325, partial [Streptomyces noursei]|uniref:hypothetical protein n=1 Tax=Streptomyces noursei TaxID=1971 RepID=UPI00344EA6DB